MTSPADRRPFTLDRRKVLLGLGMAAASGVAYARQPAPNRPRIDAEVFEEMMPDTVGPWRYATASGVVLPPSDALSDRLYDNLVTRMYEGPAGRTLMMLIAYNNRQDGVLQIHRPEICYPAGGYTLTSTQAIDVPLNSSNVLPCQGFLAQSPRRDEAVLYWTRVGESFPRRWAEQRLTVVKANLAGIIPDGILVRVSTLGNDMSVELPRMQSFIADLSAIASPELGQLLFGELALGTVA